ncbi:MAG: class I SAM-dependent methyltransferase [Planctomycetota bacterium]
MQITESIACVDSFDSHHRDRSMFQKEFCRRLMGEPSFAGAKLDIGCGGDLPEALTPIREQLGVVDGVDPFPEVEGHPLLRNRWHGELEKVDIPSEAYDLAYAYNVVEHIPTAEPFFETVRRVLKPGGVFWALTPHGKHPFAKCVRLVEGLRMKHRVAEANEGVNDYPAYYRLNRLKDIAAAASAAGFTKLEMVYMPCVQWDHYFPKGFKFIPHLHDRILGLKRKNSMLVLAYRLE